MKGFGQKALQNHTGTTLLTKKTIKAPTDALPSTSINTEKMDMKYSHVHKETKSHHRPM